MATPNTAVALRLRGSVVFSKIKDTFKQGWLNHVSALSEQQRSMPYDGEVFGDYPKDEILRIVQERFDNWGLSSGYCFVNGKQRFTHDTPSFEMNCWFHGEEKLNKHKLQAAEVRWDSDGEINTDRVRNRLDHKRGCKVMYRVAYKRSSPSDKKDLSRHWVGQWSTFNNESHTGHTPPNSPISFHRLRHQIRDYKRVEDVARTMRTAGVAYSRFRKEVRAISTDFLMSKKEYYNLANSMFKDVKRDDTPTALCAVFDDTDWEYRFRDEITADGNNRQIRQIFFWNNSPKIRGFARRFTSNALLVVDCTFRTNRRGLPLIIAMAKSNTGASFPIAFS
jgi:hypothetical protein